MQLIVRWLKMNFTQYVKVLPSAEVHFALSVRCCYLVARRVWRENTDSYHARDLVVTFEEQTQLCGFMELKVFFFVNSTGWIFRASLHIFLWCKLYFSAALHKVAGITWQFDDEIITTKQTSSCFNALFKISGNSVLTCLCTKPECACTPWWRIIALLTCQLPQITAFHPS